MARTPNALSQHREIVMASDPIASPVAKDEEGAPGQPSSVEPQALPGYLPWEQDLEMVSKFLDRKVAKFNESKQ